MSTVIQDPIGRGQITWLGVNETRGKFSLPRDSITICNDGVEGDLYRGMWRKISSHDGDYVATDGVAKDDPVLNLRQITIVDEGGMGEVSKLLKVPLGPGMFRENIVVKFIPQTEGLSFSMLPPLARMVIDNGEEGLKVLNLTERNGPCSTICNPMAAYFGGGVELADSLRESLGYRRGQMAMVRSGKTVEVKVGDKFLIFPPMP